MKFDDVIQLVGFSKSDDNHCLFTKTALDGSPIFLIIYVDDMLLFGRHADELTELVRQLRLKLAMKDLGPTRHILGMKINRNRNGRQLFLSQTDYIGRVLERFNMQSAKSASTRSPLIFGCLSEIARHSVCWGKGRQCGSASNILDDDEPV
mgnify:CR=1 FL=1